MRKNSVSIVALFLGTVVGTVVGTVAGILLAPTRGTNVRKVLSYRIKSYVERLQELVKALAHTKTAVSSQAQVEGREVVDDTIHKAERLLQDAKALATQLEQ